MFITQDGMRTLKKEMGIGGYKSHIKQPYNIQILELSKKVQTMGSS